MANVLKGKPVSDKLKEDLIVKVNELKERNITPTLAIIRLGENDSDISYEKGATKRCNEIGIEVKNVLLPLDVSQDKLLDEINKLNNDSSIHGILLFRPLPKHLDQQLIRNAISPKKDVDGCTDSSLAGIFTNTNIGYAPCTAEAALEILDFYNIDVKSKNVTIIGRSLVIGRPISMLLMHRNATITICHTKTMNIEEIAKKADIIICATGEMEKVNKNYVSSNQTIIDIGIKWNEEKQKLCGDCLYEEVEPIVENITPVPGGVGSVTTSVLAKHVVDAASRI